MKLSLLPFLVMAIVALATIPAGCTSRKSSQQEIAAPQVRVRLLAGVDRVSLKMEEAPVLVGDGGKTRRKLGSTPGQVVTLTLGDAGWMFNGTVAGTGVLEILPAGVGTVFVNGQAYRGTYRFVPTAAGKFDVVNDLDVESYLMSVLPLELFPDWTLEAYKAQAIIARTYALYEVKTGSPGRHWDLHPDERSQMYGGMKVETPKAREAVATTTGQVVAWGPDGQERIFKAYFSSCCGGVSASSADAFKETAIPPLEPKYNGNTCSISTRYNWGPVVLTKAELARRARAWGNKSGHALASVPGITGIEIGAANPFGRPRSYLVTDTAGQQYSVSSEQMRWAINADANGGPTVYSSFFRPVDSGDSIQFIEGHGFGHGVGACQWCMQARALAGDSFDQIVVRQFPQSVVMRAY